MSLPRRDIVPKDPARSVAEQKPPSRPVAQPPQPPQPSMDGSQLVQWLSVQAGNMAGNLQRNVRALMVRASSPMPVSDEVSSLRKQLRHQQQAHRELQTMLWNQGLAIETFQSKWQMAGQEAHAFTARTRSQSEDFVRAELTAAQRFEESLQRQRIIEEQLHGEMVPVFFLPRALTYKTQNLCCMVYNPRLQLLSVYVSVIPDLHLTVGTRML